jgi:hypothetical protein
MGQDHDAKVMDVDEGHALEFSVKVGLPGGRGNVAVLTSATVTTINYNGCLN